MHWKELNTSWISNCEQKQQSNWTMPVISHWPMHEFLYSKHVSIKLNILTLTLESCWSFPARALRSDVLPPPGGPSSKVNRPCIGTYKLQFPSTCLDVYHMPSGPLQFLCLQMLEPWLTLPCAIAGQTMESDYVSRCIVKWLSICWEN